MLSTLINGSLLDDASHALSVFDRGLHYGDGLFETMLFKSGQVRFLAAHLKRLQLGCERLKVPAPTEEVLRADLAAVTGKHEQGIVKLIVTRGTGARGYRPDPRQSPTRIVLLYPPPEITHEIAVRWCTTRLARNPPLAGIKHLNRLEQVLAQAEWGDATIAEGLMLDTEGEVISGTASNVFIVSDGVLATPDLRFSGVRGIMRDWVLATARDWGLEVNEGALRVDEVRNASEIFLTNAVRGIRPVTSLEGEQWPVGSVALRLIEALGSI